MTTSTQPTAKEWRLYLLIAVATALVLWAAWHFGVFDWMRVLDMGRMG